MVQGIDKDTPLTIAVTQQGLTAATGTVELQEPPFKIRAWLPKGNWTCGQ